MGSTEVTRVPGERCMACGECGIDAVAVWCDVDAPTRVDETATIHAQVVLCGGCVAAISSVANFKEQDHGD